MEAHWKEQVRPHGSGDQNSLGISESIHKRSEPLVEEALMTSSAGAVDVEDSDESIIFDLLM